MLFSRKYQKYSDEELMELLSKGKEQAFRVLYQRYNKRMYQYFLRMLNHQSEDAADFTQELFMKIIEQPEAFDITRRFSTWLYTLAGNMVKNEYRRRDRRSNKEPINLQIPITSPDCLIAQMDAPVLRKYLRLAIQQLDPIHKTCFQLRYDSQLSIKDISEILGCPEGTVKSRLHYALRKLSNQLKVLDDERI